MPRCNALCWVVVLLLLQCRHQGSSKCRRSLSASRQTAGAVTQVAPAPTMSTNQKFPQKSVTFYEREVQRHTQRVDITTKPERPVAPPPSSLSLSLLHSVVTRWHTTTTRRLTIATQHISVIIIIITTHTHTHTTTTTNKKRRLVREKKKRERERSSLDIGVYTHTSYYTHNNNGQQTRPRRARWKSFCEERRKKETDSKQPKLWTSSLLLLVWEETTWKPYILGWMFWTRRPAVQMLSTTTAAAAAAASTTATTLGLGNWKQMAARMN